MASPSTVQRANRADWPLMIAIHDALRRDLDQLLHATASHASALARWATFSDHLRFHMAAEHAVMWPQIRAKLAGGPHGQALLDAMDDERQLLGPLQAMIDDAFAMNADPGQLRQLLARLRTRLASHLAHKEAVALPLISEVLSPGELRAIGAAIRGGHSMRRAGGTIPWALADARADVRKRVLSQLPAPARLLYQTVWLPRYTRTTLPL